MRRNESRSTFRLTVFYSTTKLQTTSSSTSKLVNYSMTVYSWGSQIFLAISLAKGAVDHVWADAHPSALVTCSIPIVTPRPESCMVGAKPQLLCKNPLKWTANRLHSAGSFQGADSNSFRYYCGAYIPLHWKVRYQVPAPKKRVNSLKVT